MASLNLITLREKQALNYKETTYSYTELLQYIELYSRIISKYNPTKVIIFAENNPEWIFIFYAALKVGAIAVPIDVMSSAGEVATIVDDCTPEIIFTSEEGKETIDKALSDTPQHNNITILTKKDFNGTTSDIEVSDLVIDDIEKTAILIYTSGTTDKPKGVMLSYKNILFNFTAVCIDIPIITEFRRTIIILPLHHVFPLLGSMAGPLYIGQTIFIADKLSGESILKTLHKGKINIIIGVPGLYDMFAKSILEKINSSFITKQLFKIVGKLNSRGISKTIFKKVHKTFGGHIDYLVSGGAALSDQTAKVFKTLGFEMLPGYGMTEAAPMISFTRPGKWHIGYAGYPLEHMQIRIDSSDHIEIAGSDQNHPPIGEICVKGDNVMKGYYNNPEQTAKTLKDGWLHTGDIGYLDKYGLKITGRLKELIVTANGKNILPDEIENKFMKDNDFIKEIGIFMENNILQAAIVPDMKTIREESAEKMHSIIKKLVSDFNKTVAPYKRIKRFHITSKDLPRNRLTKLQRFKLAEHVADSQKGVKEEEETVIEGEVTEVYLNLRDYLENMIDMKVKEHDDFEIDLAMDSLARVSMIAYIENKYKILLNESDLSKLNTLRKLSDAINNQLSMRPDDTDTNSAVNEMSWKEIIVSSENKKFDLPHSGLTNRFLNMIGRFLLHILFRVKCKGRENIPDTPCIIVANHKSMIDPLLVSTNMKIKTYQKTYFYAKLKHFKSKFMGMLADKNNVILMDINKDVRESIQKLAYVITQGKNIMIFPEGTRSKERLNPFKATFAILSKELNVPVVQTVIKGAGDAFTTKGKFPKLCHKITIEFLPPIEPDKFNSYKGMTEYVRNNIEQKLNAE